MSPDSPPLTPAAGESAPVAGRRARPSGGLALLVALVAVVAVVAGVGLWTRDSGKDRPPAPLPSSPSGTPSPDLAAERTAAVQRLLADRSRAVLDGDPAAWQATVDPTAPGFAERQRELFARLREVPFALWSYELVGEGPGLPPDRSAVLPEGAAIVRVRLTYQVADTGGQADREQYLTVVSRGGRWLLAGDTDAAAAGFDTQRDLWDLGPVRVVRGRHSTVVGDTRGASHTRMRRLAREADSAVTKVDTVWTRPWSRRPLVLLPRTQKDMAKLLGDDGRGLAQIAAVTTGAFEEGLSRGDRVLINPASFDTLGAVGRAVVLTHEMTHVATRATTVVSPPIWLSEGFADYVAYEATPVPTPIVAADVIDDVRDGKAPRRLPEPADFDAGEGDIASAYEASWLACRMIASRFGEKQLVRFYRAMSDQEGPGWPEESESVLGLSADELTRQWRAYLRKVAAA